MRLKPSRWELTLISLAFLSLQAVAQSTTSAKIVVDGRGTGLIFEGLGAASAGASSRLLFDYPEPQRSQILDYLFKPNYGAALQHLKVEVGSDVNSTDGSEPSHMRSVGDHNYTRGYEWWLMEEAKKRNPNIILDALPWGAPGWVGNGHIYSDDMADYMVDFIKGAWTAHHLRIDYVGIWNERMYDGNYVKQLGKALRREHLDTRIVCCDSYPGMDFGEWGIVEALQNDPALKQTISAIGVHYPRAENSRPSPAAARTLGLPLWSSEDQPNPGSGPFVSRDWPMGGRILAHQYNSNYIEDRFTKTEIWSPITSYYDLLAAPNSGLMYANTPWSGHYEVQGTIWATAHTTQFAQPGWRYLDSASGELAGGGSYVSLRSPTGKDWSTIVETIGATSAQPVTIQVVGGLSTGQVHVWETNDTRTFEHVGDVTIHGDSFTYNLDPMSLYSFTTTVGQGKGSAVPPPAAPFLFPYSDDFESTAENRSPKYLADQDGAFEVHACEQRAGRCLQQVISRRPIPWSPLPDPFTLMGNTDWHDYTVAADVHLPVYGVATLMGRIDSADVFKDGSAPYPSGYVLRVTADDHWELLSTAYKQRTETLASGIASGAGRGWHHVAITFKGDAVEVDFDDKKLAQVSSKAHAHGMVALGSDWSGVQFDNLVVRR